MHIIVHMRNSSDIEGFRNLAHPLAQIDAAFEFFGQIDAFVKDMWPEMFDDEPPDEDDVAEAVHPTEFLATLAELGLRFEAEAPRGNDPLDDDFQYFRTKDLSSVEVLLYGWAYQAMDAVELDSRAFFVGLTDSDLFFVPDESGVAKKAWDLLMENAFLWEKVADRRAADDAHFSKHYRSDLDRVVSEGRRGAGPNEKKPVLADKIVLILRDAAVALLPEEVAAQLKHKNVSSIATALHQIVSYGKPKRLVGWVKRESAGGYIWVNPS